jgi:hypothetical protein
MCESYSRPNFNGADIFMEMFDTNGEGIITFVKPPEKRAFTMEAYCFLTSLMVNQHLRISHQLNEALVLETKQNLQNLIVEFKKELAELKAQKDSE